MAGGPNLYSAMSGDPVNRVDPSGMCDESMATLTTADDCDIIVNGTRTANQKMEGSAADGVIVSSSYFGNTQSGYDVAQQLPGDDAIIITGERLHPDEDEEEAPIVVAAPRLSPQNQQPPKTRTQCALQAFGKNWKGLGLDALGWAANLGRFGYTGQKWLSELAAYDYKARLYSATLGRFFQTDPVGYDDSPNLYAYVLNDPVNWIDSEGLETEPPIYVTAVTNFWPVWGGTTRFGSSQGGFDLSSFFGDSNVAVPAVLLPGPVPPERQAACAAEGCDAGIVITGQSKDRPFVVIGGRYVYSGYQKPAWSNEFDACFALCPIAIGGAAAAYATGWELVIGSRLRIAPFGNRGEGRVGWPHYHRRGLRPGQGIGRHRPWQTNVPDTSFWDRF